MSVLKKYTCRICITHEWKIYKLFSIGYYPDGWYFITDLSQVNWWNYIASKIHYNPIWKERRKSFLLPIDYNNTYYFWVRNPKISHHIDWKAHISWNWIKSWYDSNGEAKWLSIKSWSLHKGNDGWPMFIFNIWVNSLKNFTEITLTDEKLNKNMHLLLNQEMLVDLRKNNDHKYNYL